MKKIVALVLSLVMVLGLATVAFADNTTTTLKDTDGYDIYEATGTTSVKATDADITKVVTGNSVASDGTVTYYATTYSDGANTFVEVDATAATHKLVKNGAIVAYLYNAGAGVSTSKVVDKTVKSVKDAAKTCGDYVSADEYAVYIIDDAAYFADGTVTGWALLNGKFVALGGDASATLVKHTYEKNTYNTDGTLATVKCAVCKGVYKVLSANDVKTMAPAAYAYDTTLQVYVATGVTAAGTADEKVESAETFDAGIAMYVGMSVMAAAGSAVVLKKKD